MSDDYQEIQRNRENAFIRILAAGLQSASEEDLREGVKQAILASVKDMDLSNVLLKVLEPVVREELDRVMKTPEFGNAIRDKVAMDARALLSRLKVEATRW